MPIIIPYDHQYHNEFKNLNLVWLEKFNLVEPHDLEVLDHPIENVIDKGGYIFLLKDDEDIIGTAGIYKTGDDEFEVIKMSVDPDHRGKKYGELLLKHCIDAAKLYGAKKLILYSNSNLKIAISMYEKNGFIHVEAINTPFVTADIKMEMLL